MKGPGDSRVYSDAGMWGTDEELWYNAADIDALLARIREALKAERAAKGVVTDAAVGHGSPFRASEEYAAARAALDALLP